MRNCASGNLEIPGSMRSLSSGRALRGPVGIARNDGVWSLHASQLRRFCSRHTLATSRRNAPKALMNLPPFRGRGERRMPVAPAASCAIVVIERTRVTTSTPESPDVPARNGFNGVCRALGDRAVLPPSPADMFCLSPVGPTQLRELDTSVGVSGPHDFAVRYNISRPRAGDRSQAHHPPCNPVARKTLPRPPHPHPASVTIAIRPSGGVGCAKF
jgi:hypothetical protein